MKIRIPISSPDYTDLERKYLMEAYDSGWISSKGQFIEPFEEVFAKWLGVNHAITCCNGTTALHLALLAAEFKPGDTIYITPDSYYACSNVPKTMRGKLTKSQSADFNIIVHNYGYFNYEVSGDSQFIIEDCSEAIGTELRGRKVGTFGNISTFSFYGNKTMTTGEGGMVCTNNPEYADKIRHLKNQCMIEPYIHDGIGYNYRMTNLQAALGLAQIERIEELLDKKRNITKIYKYNLKDTFKTPEMFPSSYPVLWMNVFEVNNQLRFRKYMEENGIQTRPGFNPSGNIVMLPSGTTLTEKEVKEVCKIANAYS